MTRYEQFLHIKIDGAYLFRHSTIGEIATMLSNGVHCMFCPAVEECNLPCEIVWINWLKQEVSPVCETTNLSSC